MKFFRSFILIYFLSSCFLSEPTWSRHTVLVDPGHGGIESGAFKDYTKKNGKKSGSLKKILFLNSPNVFIKN